jgi:hypothetical protein
MCRPPELSPTVGLDVVTGWKANCQSHAQQPWAFGSPGQSGEQRPA